MSKDFGQAVPHNLNVEKSNEELAFNTALLARVRALREARRMSPEEMAEALGIPMWRYRSYEKRSPLPQYLIPRFALIVGRSIEHVLTGKDANATTAKRGRVVATADQLVAAFEALLRQPAPQQELPLEDRLDIALSNAGRRTAKSELRPEPEARSAHRAKKKRRPSASPVR